MSNLHIPEYSPHVCVPTQDAYDAACRALATYKNHLREQVETMHGVLENGPWTLIPDPRLRELVSRYVADAVAVLAAEIGADDAEAAAREVRTPVLPLRVEDA